MECVLDLLHKFAEKGDKDTLEQLYEILNSEVQLPIPVPPELAMNVAIQISTQIEIECDSHLFWIFLTYLMNSHYNFHAQDYLLLLQNSPVLEIFLHNLRVNLLKTKHDIEPLIAYLDFLQQLVIDSYERQSIIFNQEGQHVLKAVSKIFVKVAAVVQKTAGSEPLLSMSVRLLSLLAKLYPETIEQNDHRTTLWFLNIGGISIMSNIVMIIANKIDICPNIFAVVQDSFFVVYGSLLHLDTTGLDRKLYCIDRNSAYRMNVAFYKLFTDHKRTYISHALSMIYTYVRYLHCYNLLSTLESFLLYKPPEKDANSVLVVLILKCVRNSNFTNSTAYEVDFMGMFHKWSDHFPSVAALLEEPLRERPPDRDNKVRVCALPECNLDGKGLFNKMLKCGQCRKVYYCGQKHQKQHWKVHKQTCGSTATATKALLDEPLPGRNDNVRVCSDKQGMYHSLSRCGRCGSVYYCCKEHQQQHWKVHKQTCGSTSAPTTGNDYNEPVCALPGCNIGGEDTMILDNKPRVSHRSQEHQEELWKVHKPTCGSSATSTKALLQEEPLRELPPGRDDKVRMCALSGCGVNGEGLLRCSRCRSAHYCGVEHQKQHWKVHKQICGSAVATATTGTST